MHAVLVEEYRAIYLLMHGILVEEYVEEYRAIYLLMHAVLVEEGLYTN